MWVNDAPDFTFIRDDTSILIPNMQFSMLLSIAARQKKKKK